MISLEYLRKPFYVNAPSSTQNLIENIKSTFKIYFITLGLIFASALIILSVDFYISKVLLLPSINVVRKNSHSNVMEKLGIYRRFSVIIIAPFIEEILFRLPLSLKKKSIAIALSIMFYVLLGGSFLHINLSDYRDIFKILFSFFSFFFLFSNTIHCSC